MHTSSIKYIAHVKENADGALEGQDIFDHLRGTAALASSFADVFGAGRAAEMVGLVHDLGKFTDGWQDYIRRTSGYDVDDKSSGDEDRGNHSDLGAFVLMYKHKGRADKTSRLLASIVAGHHAGLPDWEYGDIGEPMIKRMFDRGDEDELKMSLRETLSAICDDERVRNLIEHTAVGPFPCAQLPHDALHLWCRMLFSCLVDADYLDTERFIDDSIAAIRSDRMLSIAELKVRLDSFMERKSRGAAPSPVNEIRAKILSRCREKAELAPGIFTLSVPTGAGKTLASMMFALDHALIHGHRRVIVAIPYTSIIEQTSNVYRYGTDDSDEISRGSVLFGADNVIEHHSNISPDRETARTKLAAENWDAPIIVTTNVQLFGSLAAARPSRCRKLHNIANSIIILDEVQLLQSGYLLSIIRDLEHLVKYFGVTVVMCSATLPALVGTLGEGNDKIEGFNAYDVIEIYDEGRDEMRDALKRVRFEVRGDDDVFDDWRAVADELAGHERVMCVVNTRASARELYTCMPDGTFHLSAQMCGEDRSDVIAEIKKRLRTSEDVRVISTQLVEAGVDIDFPIVYRAYAGLDSIVQAAGRCNREGRLDGYGRVVVFNAPVSSPPGMLRKAEEASRCVLFGQKTFELSDELIKSYFQELFSVLKGFDVPNAKNMMLKDLGGRYSFRTYASRYRLIDDCDQAAVLVPYKNEKADGAALIKLIESGRVDRDILRRAQRFTVNVNRGELAKMMAAGMIREIEEGRFLTVTNQRFYKAGIGLVTP